MITTVVVDDDFRVARLHAACVNATEGFTCVAEAHTAAQARTVTTDLRPELLLLDIYLPDEDGLGLLRSLTATMQPPPDCIVVTAARDLGTVRAAMGMGAMYYLVKPFGMRQLSDQLAAYRRWRDHMNGASGADADQATVDTLYALRRPADRTADLPHLSPTMDRVLQTVLDSGAPLSAAAIAERVGISRPTAQRYLASLERRGLLSLQLEYGALGRPVHRYGRPAKRVEE